VFFLESLPHFDESIGTFRVFIQNRLRNYAKKYAKKLMKYKNTHFSTSKELMEMVEDMSCEDMSNDDATYDYVSELIARLPNRQRRVATLRILHNYRLNEIAREMYPEKHHKLSHSIVSRHLKKAIEKLENWIKE
jgi:RNA polymerase sigma factor (sigma-70 family)